MKRGRLSNLPRGVAVMRYRIPMRRRLRRALAAWWAHLCSPRF